MTAQNAAVQKQKMHQRITEVHLLTAKIEQDPQSLSTKARARKMGRSVAIYETRYETRPCTCSHSSSVESAEISSFDSCFSSPTRPNGPEK